MSSIKHYLTWITLLRCVFLAPKWFYNIVYYLLTAICPYLTFLYTSCLRWLLQSCLAVPRCGQATSIYDQRASQPHNVTKPLEMNLRWQWPTWSSADTKGVSNCQILSRSHSMDFMTSHCHTTFTRRQALDIFFFLKWGKPGFYYQR